VEQRQLFDFHVTLHFMNLTQNKALTDHGKVNGPCLEGKKEKRL
jgi:hypothetical protein